MYGSLQIVRAAASLAVVFYHVGVAFASDKYFSIDLMGRLFSFGRYGVEVFFVLSGYIICTAHRGDFGRTDRLLLYLKKRFIRIYPTFWIVFLLTLGFAILMNAPIPTSPVVLLKAMLLVNQSQDVAGPTGAPIIIVAWSLHYEILFYILFAFLLLSRGLASVLLGLGLLLFMTLPGLYWFDSALGFLCDKYTHLFLMGVLAAWVRAHTFLTWRSAWFLLFLSLMVVFIGTVGLIQGSDLADDVRTYIVGVSAAVILSSLVYLEDAGLNMSRYDVFRAIGDSSYLLYLIHYPLVSILCKLIVFLYGRQLDGLYGAIFPAFIVIFFCVSVSVVLHRWVERPLISRMSKFMLA